MNLKTLLKHKKIIIIGLLIVVGVGFLIYRRTVGNQATIKYATAAVARGTLIISVAGSGQVNVSDQVNITPKVSGELTALYAVKDQAVKTGQLLAILDSSSAQKTVRDAQLSLDDAQYALAQAEQNYKDVETEANQTLTGAYEDGYDAVSTTFFKLASYMTDLKNTLGTEKNAQEYITGYELILGRNSSFTQKLIEDYDQANTFFNQNFAFFRTVSREDGQETIYQLVVKTLETTKMISQALDSGRHMFDAISLYDYTNLHAIAAQIDTMQPKIQSDVSAVYSTTNSLQAIKDTIDNTNKNTPGKIEDAQRAVQAAQNTVVKKEEALADAQKELAKYSIYAPFSGVIASVGDVKKGDTISANTILATLITKQKIAELTLNEIDAAKVKTNQKVTLTFDALPDISITGKVSEVDTVGQASQGVVSYGIKIAFDNDVEQVKPGMSVTADIIIEAKPDVLVLPNSAIKSQGGSSYVELVETGADSQLNQQLLANVSGMTLPQPPKIQQVEVGLSNDLSTEIISGLKEGDIVVTSTVNSSQTTQTRTAQTQGLQIPGISGSSGGQIRTFSR